MVAQDKKEQDAESFYVGVHEPIEARRSLLEGMKGLIQVLQRHERFKRLRADKEELLKTLRSQVKEMSSLSLQLRNALPRLKIPKEEMDRIRKLIEDEKQQAALAENEAVKPAKKDVGKKDVTEKEPAPKKRTVSELDRLQEQLTEIEKQLGNLK